MCMRKVVLSTTEDLSLVLKTNRNQNNNINKKTLNSKECYSFRYAHKDSGLCIPDSCYSIVSNGARIWSILTPEIIDCCLLHKKKMCWYLKSWCCTCSLVNEKCTLVFLPRLYVMRLAQNLKNWLKAFRNKKEINLMGFMNCKLVYQ